MIPQASISPAVLSALGAGILAAMLAFVVQLEADHQARGRRAHASLVAPSTRREVPLSSIGAAISGAISGEAPLRVIQGLALLTCLLVLAGFAVQALELVALGAIAGVGSMYLWMQRSRWTLAARIERQLPEAMDVMANALTTGATLFQALQFAARETKPPLATLLASAVQRCEVGATVDESLLELQWEADSRDAGSIVAALSIQRTTGGNLSRLLREGAEFVREEQRLRADARALSAQARYSSQMIAALPFLLFGIFYVFYPEFIRPLTDTLVGQFILAYCLASVVFGFYLIWRIATAIERA